MLTGLARTEYNKGAGIDAHRSQDIHQGSRLFCVIREYLRRTGKAPSEVTVLEVLEGESLSCVFGQYSAQQSNGRGPMPAVELQVPRALLGDCVF